MRLICKHHRMSHIEGNVLTRYILGLCSEQEKAFMNEWLKEGQNESTYRYMLSLLGQEFPEAISA